MILIGLGANLPTDKGTEPAETLRQALICLNSEPDIVVLKTSRIWLTAPVPVSDQPWYHNAAAALETQMSPHVLLKRLQVVEKDFGRVRTVRNAPRVLDLDLLAYHDEIMQKPELILPHPRLHERAFVLYPLQDIAPDWKHPAAKKSVADMIKLLPSSQELKVEGEGALYA